MPTDRQLRAFSATLAVLVASALPHSAQADMRTLDTPWVDMSYDDTVLKPSDWTVTYREPDIHLLDSLGGSLPYQASTRFAIDIKPVFVPGLQVDLPRFLDLWFQFKAGHEMQLDSSSSFVSTLFPGSISVASTTVFQAPADAQLLTARGQDSLLVQVATDRRVKRVGIAATDPGLVSVLTIDHGAYPPDSQGSLWQGAPASGSGGGMTVSVSHVSTGSGHLVPSTDMGCIELSCMTAVRSTADFQGLTITFIANGVIQPIGSVPEPSSLALAASGLLLLVGLAGRRRSRPGPSLNAPCAQT